jgi:hypothetical protein
MGKTTITVSDELWKKINDYRKNSKETIEDVLWRWNKLSNKKSKENGNT